MPRRASLEARVRGAGAGLSENMIEWGRRPAQMPCARITARDLRLLAALHDYGYLTTALCSLLFWGRETYAARRRLKLLHDVGLVERLRPRSIYHGGGEWIYRLSLEGWRWLLNNDMAADGDDYTPAEITSIAYLEHDLQVSALMADIALRAAQDAGSRDPSRGLMGCVGFDWLGPRRGVVDLSPARAAYENTIFRPGAARYRHPGRGAPGVLRPDATLRGQLNSGKSTAVLVEYDRTRRASKQRDRLRRYDYFLNGGWRHTQYGALDVYPVLIVVCATDAQLPTFLAAADDELCGWRGDDPYAPVENRTYPGRQRVGLTSRQRLLAGDGRLVGLPPLPPAHRSKSRAVPGHEYELPLWRLWAAPADGATA